MIRPPRIEHRRAASNAEALTFVETAPPNRVGYMIDMVAARDGFVSISRSRGTPTPAVVLAQFLSSVTALEHSTPPEYPASPLMVYSKRIAGPTLPSAAFARARQSGAAKGEGHRELYRVDGKVADVVHLQGVGKNLQDRYEVRDFMC